MGATPSKDEDTSLGLATPNHIQIGKRRMLDRSIKRCSVCRGTFGFCNKRHYCRRCGEIVCDLCTVLRHYKQRHGHGFRVCQRCDRTPILDTIPRSVWHLILSFCGNVAHHRTIQVCHRMQMAVPLPFPMGDTWDSFFTEGHFISKGANGSVFKTTQRSDPKRQQVAVKVIQKSTIFSLRKWHHIHREIEAMRACRHPHVVELVNVMQCPESVFIVLQFAHGGDLFDWLVSRRHPSEADVKPIAIQLLSTLAHMHDICGCVHRDIKPENILLERKPKGSEIPHIRLADFGFARVFPEVARPNNSGNIVVGVNKFLKAASEVHVAATPCGTLGFAAPEIIEAYSSRKEQAKREEEEERLAQTGKGGTSPKHNSPPQSIGASTVASPKTPIAPITPVELMRKMDIFAAGVTFCILLTGCEPFPCHSSKAHLEAVHEGASFTGRHWAHVSSEAKELLRRMLHPTAAKRPSAMDCLQSRWLSGSGRSAALQTAVVPELRNGSAAPSAAQPLLLSAKDDDELAASFQKSIRSLRRNDGVFVTNARTGAVRKMPRPDVLEDTLVDEPPVAPPGPNFAPATARGTASATTTAQPKRISAPSNTSMISITSSTQPTRSPNLVSAKPAAGSPSQTPRLLSAAADDDGLDADLE